MTKIRTAIFPVAGMGTRFLPATKAIPKEMLVVVDKPLIQYAVEEAKEAGIERFIFISSQGKTAIEDHFDSAPHLEEALKSRGKLDLLKKVTGSQLEAGQAMFIRQASPNGLGHAILCAHKFVKEDAFAVILADDLVLSPKGCLKQMIDLYQENDGNMVAVQDVPLADTSRYGVLDINKEEGKRVFTKGVVEKPKPEDAPSTTTIIGRYILRHSIFKELQNAKIGLGGEIQITDTIKNMMPDTPLTGYRFDGTRYDCGQKTGWLEANIAFALQDSRNETVKMMQRVLKGL